jgi:hypothetical protein
VDGGEDAEDHEADGGVNQWQCRLNSIQGAQAVRLIGKWLAAGAIEDGAWTESGKGSPQGASASPLLANVYLHYVLDLWVGWRRKRHAHGDVVIVGFEHKDDAERFLGELRGRFAKFGLEPHPGKTRLTGIVGQWRPRSSVTPVWVSSVGQVDVDGAARKRRWVAAPAAGETGRQGRSTGRTSSRSSQRPVSRSAM